MHCISILPYFFISALVFERIFILFSITGFLYVDYYYYFFFLWLACEPSRVINRMK